MGFIYIIKNDVNDKVYIGKTLGSQEKRFKEHCHDANKRILERRPLYRAMRKYGTEHFEINQIEECSKESLSEREIFWIDFYDSYKTGYNATRGGDEKSYLDQPGREICAIYLSGISAAEIARRFGCTQRTIKDLLQNEGVELRNKRFATSDANKKRSKKVIQIDLQSGEVVHEYNSVSEAEMVLNGNVKGHIIDVCKGRRHSSYGYLWKYAN